MLSTANSVVYRDHPTSGDYHAATADGTSIATGPDPYPVLQAALDRYFWDDPSSGRGAGTVHVHAGDYVLRPDFPGFDVRAYSRLTMDPTARFTVPTGYAGYAFRLRSDDASEVVHSLVDGGLVREAGEAQHNWTAFLLEAASTTGGGVLFNRLSNSVVFNAGTAVRLWVSGTDGFINANAFDCLRLWGCREFISYQIDPPYQPGQENLGIVGNTFVDVECQSDSWLDTGIAGLTGSHNSLLDVKVWDVPAGRRRATIAAAAYRTRIIGGYVASADATLFVDNGVETELVAAL